MSAELATTTRPTPDATEIRRTLDILHDADAVIELRAIFDRGRKRATAGYFDGEHRDSLVREAARLNTAGAAVYITMNPIDAQLLARYANRVQEYATDTATDANVTRRRWLLVDVDPARPKGTSATAEQLEAAIARAQAVAEFLAARGWPDPVVAASGNGVHLLYRIELPNDDDSRELVKHVLEALGARFDDRSVKVDKSVFNAARIVKLHGSVANKGDHLPAAPWRLSRILTVPETVELVSVEQLRELAAEADPPAEARRMHAWTEADVAAFLERGNIEATGPAPHEGALRWKLSRCPFNAEHGYGEAAMFLRPDGRLGFRCMHDSCAGKGWAELRELVDGPRDQRDRRAPHAAPSRGPELPPLDAYDDALAPKPRLVVDNSARAGAAIKPLCELGDIGVGAFLDTEPAAQVWLVDQWLELGVAGVLAAAGHVGKSFLMLLLSIAIATGRPFFGMKITDPGAVLLICAEDRRVVLHRRLRRIVQLMREGEEFGEREDELLRERLFIHCRVGEDNLLTRVVDGQLIRTGMVDRIAALAEQIPALKLIGLDPVSRFHGGVENDNQHATRFVEVLESLREKIGAAIIAPHHVNKESLRVGTEQLSIASLRGAVGLPDAARWVAIMATLRRDAAEEYGIEPDDARYYVRLELPKNSDAPPWPGMWLKRLRERGGVLVPADFKLKHTVKAEQKGEDRYRETLPKLQGLIRQNQDKGTALTMRALRQYGGSAGLFHVGEKLLVAIAERAIAEGAIKAHPTGDARGTVELRTW
jgi:hypothetical protein